MSFSPPNCIRTFTGKEVNIFNPTKDMFCIEDIAWALSKEQRWGNHLRYNYSVAQHCAIGTELISAEHKFSFLMHEATEAYMHDVPTPHKSHIKFKDYREIEDGLMTFLSGVFGFQYPLHPVVVEMDAKMAEMEWKSLVLHNEPFNYVLLRQDRANKKFLQLYRELSKR